MTNTQTAGNVETHRRNRVAITYEYVPILGDILGYERVAKRETLGSEVHVHLNHSLTEYDRLFVNGEEIQIPKH